MCRSQSSEEKAVLKKGPWSPEEDKKLVAFIQQHGQISWRELPSKAGLERCGRSCRLRWNNYLRPGIKRGKFSLQEERTIIQLHAFLGNRWSAIATHMPRRTDNDIKNHWNAHLKKRFTRMGIDPSTHKPITQVLHSTHSSSSLISHMAQWESARLEAETRLRESKLKLGSSSTQQPARLAIQKILAQPSLTPKDKNNTKVHHDMYALMLTTAADDEPPLTMSPPALSFPERGEKLHTYPTTSADCAEILTCSTRERRASLEDDDIMVAVEAFLRTCQ